MIQELLQVFQLLLLVSTERRCELLVDQLSMALSGLFHIGENRLQISTQTCSGSGTAKVTAEPQLRVLPVAKYRGFGHSKDLRDLLEFKTAKNVKLDDLAAARIDLFQIA